MAHKDHFLPLTLCMSVILSHTVQLIGSHPQYNQVHQYNLRRTPNIFKSTYGSYNLPVRQYEIDNVIDSHSDQFVSDPRMFYFYNQFDGISTIPRRSLRICQDHNDRYNQISGTCETIGTQGSCRPYMVFVGNEQTDPEDRMYGHCECDFDRYDHPLVSVGGQCHFLFTQANCLPGYWLTMSTTLGPVCQVNPCQPKWLMSSLPNDGIGTSSSTPVYVLYRGQCAKLNSASSRRFCSKDNEMVMFVKGSFEPSCVQQIVPPKRIFRRQITKTKAISCRDGYSWDPEHHRCLRYVTVEQSDEF